MTDRHGGSCACVTRDGRLGRWVLGEVCNTVQGRAWSSTAADRTDAADGADGARGGGQGAEKMGTAGGRRRMR